MASVATEEPTVSDFLTDESSLRDGVSLLEFVSDDADPLLGSGQTGNATVKHTHKTTSSGVSYRMMDVRSSQQGGSSAHSIITPKKKDLLANFVAPASDHNLGLDQDIATHTIVQADGTIATVDHTNATRRLPTEILYDQEGLRLFDEITKMPSQEYYLTEAEKDIFQHQMDRLVPLIPDGCAIVELGCGSMAKTAIFLRALRKAGKKDLSFYAIDLEQTSLESSIEDLIEFELTQQQHQYSTTNGGGDDDDSTMYQYCGILGSYNQALETNILKDLNQPKVFLWLGSSIGNWTHHDAQEFLSSFSEKVMQPFDLFMIGMDRRNDPLTIAKAYNDSHGITKEFGLNGLRHLNQLLGRQLFEVDAFDYFAGYNEEAGRHEAYFCCKKDMTIQIPAEFVASHVPTKVMLKKNELINYEFSYKYSNQDVHNLCDHTKFHLSELLFDSSRRYSFAVLSKAAFEPVPRDLIGRAKFPTLAEFEEVWKLWHTLTSPTICRDPLEKPIDLRHPILFYMGHIPAFQDIFQSRHFNQPLTEPAYYATIFERGINPVVEDPTVCHAHSEVPNEWPDVEEVREYDAKANDRVRSVYEKMIMTPGETVDVGMQRLGRQLSIALEHTIMHSETFIYMLVQLKRVLLPRSYMPAYLRSATHEYKALPPVAWVDIRAGSQKRGIANFERDDDKKVTKMEYGWDNEVPVREYSVNAAFQAQSRPVTCGEYLEFLNSVENVEERKRLVPASWMEQATGKYAMLTLFGPIEVERCSNCPVTMSYKLAEQYQNYLRRVLSDDSIRLPTEEEWVVMQSQLKNGNGECHDDFDFMNWMPAPLKEHHTVGSVWEWTSTVFDKHEGFQASDMYPGYSADFFDGLHNVVRGAAWCTHGRVANRLRNYYQRSYPYAFVGARFIRDA